MDIHNVLRILFIFILGYQICYASLNRGDMWLTKEQVAAMKSDGEDRQGSQPLITPWPNGYVPFIIDASVAPHRKVIRQGMDMWEEVTCLQFVENPNIGQKPHLRIKDLGEGICNSYVGIIEPDGQDVSIGKGCETPQIVCHETGHAIGLFHEQDRPDSEQYLYKYTKNLDPNNTEILNTVAKWNVYGVPYDYLSIMQYSAFAFSANGRLTLVPKDHTMEEAMSNALKPTFNDALLINKMYNCTDRCSTSGVNCQNGGYAAWVRKARNCRCQCPDGFTGNQCQTKTQSIFCGAKVISPSTIQSPFYPNLPNKEVHCGWYIKAPAGKKVQVTFDDFNLLGRYDQDKVCYWDVLRIRIDKLNSDDPGIKYCGNELHGISITAKSEVGLYFQGFQTGNVGFKATVNFL